MSQFWKGVRSYGELGGSVFGRQEPGDGLNKGDIYEVWGDIVENAAGEGAAVVAHIEAYLRDSYLAEAFNCQRKQARDDQRPFLDLSWGDFSAHIDARPFGEHLDVYAILAMHKGTFQDPDPAARLAGLEGWQRRDLQLFQSVLKQAMESALEALDEGRLV